jgi:hypothetical protein
VFFVKLLFMSATRQNTNTGCSAIVKQIFAKFLLISIAFCGCAPYTPLSKSELNQRQYACSVVFRDGSKKYVLIGYLSNDYMYTIAQYRLRRLAVDWETFIPVFNESKDTIQFFAQRQDSLAPAVVWNGRSFVYATRSLSCELCDKPEVAAVLKNHIYVKRTNDLYEAFQPWLDTASYVAIEEWLCAIYAQLNLPVCDFATAIDMFISAKHDPGAFFGMCGAPGNNAREWSKIAMDRIIAAQIRSLLREIERDTLLAHNKISPANTTVFKEFCSAQLRVAVFILNTHDSLRKSTFLLAESTRNGMRLKKQETIIVENGIKYFNHIDNSLTENKCK